MVRKKKKKRVKERSRFDDVPQHLREFIDHIALRERPDEEADKKKLVASKRKKELKDEGVSIKVLTSGVNLIHLFGFIYGHFL